MRIFVLLAVALGAAAPALAVDLGKIDAAPAKEPAYQSAAPRYCLLVFGPEAKTRVWVVIDGDALYVDRNGNGDLTEEGEKFKLSKPEPSGLPQLREQRYSPSITVMDGRLKHTNLQITQRSIRADLEPQSESDRQLKALLEREPQAMVYSVSVAAQVRELPGGKIAFTGRLRQYSGGDAQGALQFSAKPKDAPVIHFGGPWQMALLVRQTLPLGDKPGDLMTMIGTPGRGPGAFASLAIDGLIAQEVHPVAELEFPGKTPMKLRVVLKHRC